MKQIFKKTNRFLAAFLAVAMVLTMLPVSQATAWADELEVVDTLQQSVGTTQHAIEKRRGGG